MPPYRHPGQAFIDRYGAPQSEEDVFHYVTFLRQEAGLSDQPPIALSQIYQHFGIPTPLKAPLDEQQGILVDSNTGVILIRENDPLVRQRFTEGHELMELLFDAEQQARHRNSLPQWNEQRKERLCDQGAADLLMPLSSFVPHLLTAGISVATGRSLAKLYQTSLLATLVRMMQLGTGQCALIVWHAALKPTETKPQASLTTRPAKRLRVWWRMQTADWQAGFIPKDKSIAHDSLISVAYMTGQPHNGRETIHLGWGSIACQVEALPLQIGEKYCVLSLLHSLPSAEGR